MMGMTKSILLFCPQKLNNPFSLEASQEDLSIFNQSGAWQELVFLGKKAAIAPLWVLAQAKAEPTKPWACAELVHIHAARDHLVLTDPTDLNILPEEEEALRLSAIEVIRDFSPVNFYPSIQRWVFPAGDLASLMTYSPSQALGRNIDAWMPKDTLVPGMAKSWRKFQNEIQMLWHDHPVNQARSLRGALPINSIWLYGIGSLEDLIPHPIVQNIPTISTFRPYAENLSQLRMHHWVHEQSIVEYLQKIPLESLPIAIESCDLHSLTEWSLIWNQVLQLLHQEQITHIDLIKHLEGDLYLSRLSKDNFRGTLLQGLFLKNQLKKIKFPDWDEFYSKVQWKKLEVSLV